MKKPQDSRARALEGAERLFRTQGYAATGLTEILKVSGAPKGSFYFHFPEGKQQLAGEVLQAYGSRVEAGLRVLAAKHAGDPAGFVRSLCKGSAKEMAAAGWTLGCAAQNLTNEIASGDPDLAGVLARLFAAWIAVIAAAIRPGYPSKAAAERRATALLAALEGARTLARAGRSDAAFDAVLDLVVSELRQARSGGA
jgi:TetR/AcrR family transcriptional regulator, lmrAB and yxaGH operons repressor